MEQNNRINGTTKWNKMERQMGKNWNNKWNNKMEQQWRSKQETTTGTWIDNNGSDVTLMETQLK